MSQLNWDVLYDIFILLDRCDLSRCSMVCRGWYNATKLINRQERNWRNFDCLAAHYKNVVIPRVLALNLYQSPLYEYSEMIMEPDKYGTPEYCINSLIARSQMTRDCFVTCWDETLSDILANNTFKVWFKYKRDLINNFNQIVVPYVCSGQMDNASGVAIYQAITRGMNCDYYVNLRKYYQQYPRPCKKPGEDDVNLVTVNWVRYHYLNAIDLFVWFYNHNPDLFKKEFIYDPGDDFILALHTFTKSDFYIFDSLSEEIKCIVGKGIIKKRYAYQEIITNFGQKPQMKLLLSWVKFNPKLRSWILENAPEWIFYLVRDRQVRLLNIFLKFERKSLQKLRNLKGENLYQYSTSSELKHGSPLENIISKLKKLKF